MAKAFDKEGNEIEVFLPADVEAAKADAIKAEQEKIAIKDKELEALKDKDLNFKNLKDAAAIKDKELEDLKKSTAQNEEARLKDIHNDVFNQLAGNDPDLRAKLEAEFKTFRGEPKTKDEILAQAQKALSIVKPPVVPGAFDAFKAANGGAGSSAPASGKKFEPTAEVASVGSKLGISEEDFKKYGGQI